MVDRSDRLREENGVSKQENKRNAHGSEEENYHHLHNRAQLSLSAKASHNLLPPYEITISLAKYLNSDCFLANDMCN